MNLRKQDRQTSLSGVAWRMRTIQQLKEQVNWGKVRRYLAVATDLLGKLPEKGDGPLKTFIKVLAIVDSFDKKLGKSSEVYDFFDKLDVKLVTNPQFVELFFSTPLKDSFQVRRFGISDYADVVIATDEELGNLYFLEYRWGVKPEPSENFWHSKGFNFEAALDRMWKLFDDGIHISLKAEPNRTIPRTTYKPVVYDLNPLIGPAKERLEDFLDQHSHYVKDGFSRTYLFLGKQGVGKSTFATRLARAHDLRILLINAKGLTVAGANDLSFLVSGLRPGLLVLDDLDQVAEMPTVMPMLLEGLSDLKARHPSVTAILTANDVSAFHPASLRPGRVDQVIEFPDPGPEERLIILKGYLKEFKISENRLNEPEVKDILEDIVKETEGLTAAYLREVAIQLLRNPEKEVVATIRKMKELAEKAKGTKEGETKDAKPEPPKASAS